MKAVLVFSVCIIALGRSWVQPASSNVRGAEYPEIKVRSHEPKSFNKLRGLSLACRAGGVAAHSFRPGRPLGQHQVAQFCGAVPHPDLDFWRQFESKLTQH